MTPCPKLTSFAAFEGRISPFGRLGGADMPLLEVHDLGVSIGRLQPLDGISLQLDRG